jgi:hypothetical protein
VEFFDRIYLDKEKDIIVNLYKENDDELTYIIETPNHKTGNLITNLARICNVETIKDENDMKVIKGTIPAEINADNDEVYCFRLGGIKIANIYANGKVFIKAKIPAINKTLMSQTKEYKIPVENVLDHSELYKRGIGSNHGDISWWLVNFGYNMDKYRDAVRKVLAEGVQVTYIDASKPPEEKK